MKLIQDDDKCTGCAACINICPKDAINMVMREGFYYPQIDEQKCIECDMCKKYCPVSDEYSVMEKELVGYAAKTRDNIREKCSSGGVFSKIAEYVLENDGYICGAAYDRDFNVRHKLINQKKALYELLGSKYVQSEIGFVFREIEERLKENKMVLFSGTPCQTHGLKRYLGNDYENLICVDLICHGVPSPVMWKKYLDEVMNKKKNLVEINMRDKCSGWLEANFSYRFSYADGVDICLHNSKVPYQKCFVGDIALRESCYKCKYRKHFHPQTDIVIGDFWGIEIMYPELCDEKGVSIAYACSEKGEHILHKADLLLDEVDLYRVLENNAGALKNPPISRHRLKKYFMKLMIDSSFVYAYRMIKIPLLGAKVSDRIINVLESAREKCKF